MIYIYEEIVKKLVSEKKKDLIPIWKKVLFYE